MRECECTLCAISIDLTEVCTESDAKSVGCHERRHFMIEIASTIVLVSAIFAAPRNASALNSL